MPNSSLEQLWGAPIPFLGYGATRELPESTSFSSNLAENHKQGGFGRRGGAAEVPRPWPPSSPSPAEPPPPSSFPCCLPRSPDGGCQVSARKCLKLPWSPRVDNVCAR